ncbi:MAG: cytochrome c [Alphaproteobacteria bacterium]|nr:cytochrome c [Alphaproteobacteria bacterium]
MFRRGLLLAALFLPFAGAAAQEVSDKAAILRGEYVSHAAGCYGCHTDVKGKGAPLAGGRRLKTPFGDFVGPNITPDPTHGIGGWTLADFARALREGVSPAGDPYYPAFPYTSFSRMNEADIADLWAWLQTVKPNDTANGAHDLNFPYGWRWLTGVWRSLYFAPGEFEAGDPPAAVGEADREFWARGAYLVRVLGHCGECHTPRGGLGAMDPALFLAGNAAGAEGAPVPNITPDRATGLGGWTMAEIEDYLEIGMDPDGDFAGGAMAEVIERATGKLTPEDRRAVAVFLTFVPAVERKIARPPG